MDTQEFSSSISVIRSADSVGQSIDDPEKNKYLEKLRRAEVVMKQVATLNLFQESGNASPEQIKKMQDALEQQGVNPAWYETKNPDSDAYRHVDSATYAFVNGLKLMGLKLEIPGADDKTQAEIQSLLDSTHQKAQSRIKSFLGMADFALTPNRLPGEQGNLNPSNIVNLGVP